MACLRSTSDAACPPTSAVACAGAGTARTAATWPLPVGPWGSAPDTTDNHVAAGGWGSLPAATCRPACQVPVGASTAVTSGRVESVAA